MTISSIHRNIKRFGVIGSVSKLVDNKIKEYDKIRKYFLNKNGLEIGGPSAAFASRGYIPIYNIAKKVDNVNFSAATTWTGTIDAEKGFIVKGRNIGRVYIADTIDLSCIADNSYDFCLSSNNIEHIANPMKAMNEWVKKINGGGDNNYYCSQERNNI